eukprot:9244189-Lingulodinium_polyedra.AAC.1
MGRGGHFGSSRAPSRLVCSPPTHPAVQVHNSGGPGTNVGSPRASTPAGQPAGGHRPLPRFPGPRAARRPAH